MAPRFRLTGRGLPLEAEVVGISGIEEISRPHRFEIALAVPKHVVFPFDAVVGMPMRLSICGLTHTRYVHGFAWEVAFESDREKVHVYRLYLVSALMLLSLRQGLRIHQTRKTQEIVTQVLAEHGITDVEWRLEDADSYTPRDYCVQYRETDLDYVSRLLEEEGIAYHFEHGRDKATLVLGDSQTSLKSIEGNPSVIFHAGHGAVHPNESVHSFAFDEKMKPEKVTLQDHNFKEARAVTNQSGESPPQREVYDHPGEFTEGQLAGRLAQVRVQELRAFRRVGTGRSDCNRMVAGRTFTLGGPGGMHPQVELNTKYRLTRVSHLGSQPQALGQGSPGPATYSNVLEVIPATVEFRPERVTPRPTAWGVHTAFVIGPEEIYVDEHGRVRVVFNWDRGGQDNPEHSCWIRVAQDWSGGSWGGIFLPRVGQEVLVSFLEGDPDRPLITGRVYDGQQVVPYGLPAQKTKSTLRSASSPVGAGYNEIRYEDQKGGEEMFIHSGKDQNMVVEDDRTTAIAGSDTKTVGTTSTTTVGGAHFLNAGAAISHIALTIGISGLIALVANAIGSVITMTPGSISIFAPQINITGSQVNFDGPQQRQQSGNW
jgi:type VI secretion system secreted protein VgrG